MATQLTAKLGLFWFKESLRTLKLQPLAFTGIVVFSILVSGLLSSLPYIGMLLASLWMPFANVMTGFAARDTLAGRTPVYFTLIAIFRDKASRWPLLMIGLLASVWMEADMFVFDLLSSSEIAKWKITADSIDVDSILNNIPVAGVITAIALYIPLLFLTVFAPLLVVQNRQSVGKSLFYSFFGTVRAFVPELVWVVLVALLSSLIFITVESISLAAGSLAFFQLSAPLLVAILSAVVQAGVWVMFRDIFADSRPDGSLPLDLEPERSPKSLR